MQVQETTLHFRYLKSFGWILHVKSQILSEATHFAGAFDLMDLAKFLRRDSVRALIFDEVFVESFGIVFFKTENLEQVPRSFSTIGFSLVRGRIWPLRFSDVGKGRKPKKNKLHVMYLYTYLLQKLSSSLLSLMKSRPLIGESCWVVISLRHNTKHETEIVEGLVSSKRDIQIQVS